MSINFFVVRAFVRKKKKERKIQGEKERQRKKERKKERREREKKKDEKLYRRNDISNVDPVECRDILFSSKVFTQKYFLLLFVPLLSLVRESIHHCSVKGEEKQAASRE